MNRIKSLGWVLAVLLMGLLTTQSTVLGQATPAPVEQVILKDKTAVRTFLVTWRNGAAADTTTRLFTAAAVLSDTSREIFLIGGANTISLQDSFTIQNDSAMVHVYLQISNDGSNWYTFNNTGGSATHGRLFGPGNAAAADSSGSADTGDSPFVRVVNVASPPTWARFARVIARKHNSAADDTVKLTTHLEVHYADE